MPRECYSLLVPVEEIVVPSVGCGFERKRSIFVIDWKLFIKILILKCCGKGDMLRPHNYFFLLFVFSLRESVFVHFKTVHP